MRFALAPRGTGPAMWRIVTARARPCRSSGTSSVPPASAREPLPSAAAASSVLDGRRSSTALSFAYLGLAERAQHLLARRFAPVGETMFPPRAPFFRNRLVARAAEIVAHNED